MIAGIVAQIRRWFTSVGGQRLALPDPLKLAAEAHDTRRPAPVPPSPAVTSEVRDERVAQRKRSLALRLFGANHPVESPHDLFGRERELDRLSSDVLDSGMHAVVHGPRGSGKTSLVRVFGDVADARGCAVLYQTCAGDSGFGDLIRPYLEEIGAGAFDMQKDAFADALTALGDTPSSRAIANLLARIGHDDVVLILDEFDRLEDAATKAQLGLLAKVLSDMRARVQLVFVGISRNVDDLLEVHASVRRHIVAIGLAPIPGEEVEKFITTTAGAIGLRFLPEAVSLLRWLVCGSPYHMRLYSLQASLVALDAGRDDVDDRIVVAGLKRALAGWKSMNERDNELFARLIETRAFPLAALETFAIRSATSLEFTFDDMVDALSASHDDPALTSRMAEALAPALGQMSKDGSRLVFEDVLAPQFLLAMCAMTRMEVKAPTLVTEGRIR